MNYDKYKDIFISEANEHLDLLDSNLIELEKNPKNKDTLKELMRHSHTLKGIAATAGLGKISNLVHSLEGMLENIKNNIATGGVKLLFGMLDEIRNLISHIDDDSEKEANPLTEQLGELEVKDKEEDKGVINNPNSITGIKELKIRAEKIDAIMEITSELLLNKMALNSPIREQVQEAIIKNATLLQSLQYQVLQLRLIPVSQIFNRFPRMVRDLATDLNKEITFEIKGEELELDREILDALGEPLIHLLRNAIDRGIEKNGTLSLSAFRDKAQAVIEVKDNGKGINWDKLKKKASESGIAFTTNDDLLFAGISSTDHITEISGRGVGMSIVKQKISNLGGNIEIISNETGTTFRLNVPTSLSIIKGLILLIGTSKYAIPLTAIEKLVTLSSVQPTKQADQEIIILNEKEIPLIRLNTILNNSGQEGVPITEELNQIILISTIKDNVYGFIVDKVFEPQDIVVKNISPDTQKRISFSLVTILEDGMPIPILDLNNLINHT